ncbi:hypothetical protein M2212_003115 [Bradyrhizobium elkanii]|uniref:hypothetical protein n=1 Tax=Bradyrhizobium elkanii TaxID=29448 RepID=UPI002169DCDB|nr:hypothetical protein [Bradyrhizobium elkanii]MCS3476269.1 hypothetical protein [Bradyrhizobium elkanii]MCS3686660.1 hypothetical protein [Bradyrhizobium elkanii]
MTDEIEDGFVSECRRQGVQPGRSVMREAAVILAGSAMTDQGLISLPSKGVISLPDLVRSFRASMPGSFSEIGADKPDKQLGNLTESMRQEIAATRQAPRLPDDWRQARAKYEADSVTSRMMAERERTWK